MKNLFKLVLFALILPGSTSVLAQVPVYSSYPSASAVIFLDFDGHTVNGTSWNFNGPIFCGPSNLTDAKVAEVYNRIAEDYRPFNINITTDSTKYWAAPANKRTRVIFTITSEWYGRTGGVAYMGSFSWGDNTPCFVFSALLNYVPKNIAEAGAHEAGHTLGLQHQASYDANCVKTSDYHYGVGSGQISWAPIMGVGYYKNVTSWHNGPDPYGCNDAQKDLDVISNATNGYREDDFAETFAAAGTAAFAGDKFSVNGTITTPEDKDIIKFTLNDRRPFKLNAIPTNVGAGDAGSNLDLKVQLFNEAGSLIGNYDPALSLSASVDTILNAGSYYLLVDGTANEYATDYGSLGSYALSAESPIVVLPVRLLELKGIAENGTHKLNWKIDADEKVVQQVLEVSTNGRDFKPLKELTAEARNYVYNTDLSGTVFYRLNIFFDNSSRHYSNIIAMRSNNNTGKPKLVSNVIGNTALMVTSPSTYQYIVADYSGRTVASGQVTKGSSTINTNYLSNGTYIVRFMNEHEQFSEKFMKQ